MTWRASSRGVTTVEIPRLRFGNDVGITASRNVRSAVALGGLLTVRASGPRPSP